jgi:hypothetical protein
MFRTKPLLMLAVLLMSTAAYADSSMPRLSIDDIDQLARDKVVRQLKSGDQPASQPQAAVPAPVSPPKADPAPVPVHVEERAEPVHFVGAFGDATGSNVLYEYRGAVYPAHVGEKLLNGWSVKKVDGYQVSVSYGKRTWTEPITGGSPQRDPGPMSGGGGPLRSLVDLGAPLPPGLMPGPAASPLGR